MGLVASFSQESFALTSAQKSASPGGFTDLTLTKPLLFFHSLHFFCLSRLWHHLNLVIFTQIPLKMQISRGIWSYSTSLCIPGSRLYLFMEWRNSEGGRREQVSAHSFACKCEIGELCVPWWQMLISSSLKQKCREGFCFFKDFFGEMWWELSSRCCWCSWTKPGGKGFSCGVFKCWKNSLAVRLFCLSEWKRGIR